MQIFADENVPRLMVTWLSSRGHDLLYAAEVEPGALDQQWLRRAEEEGRVILTSDKDFGDLIFRDRPTSGCVILLRLDELRVAERLARLEEGWDLMEADPAGKFFVISVRKVRVRNLDTDAS